jgi:hypothetical protein
MIEKVDGTHYLIKILFEDMYELDESMLTPSVFGNAVERRRSYHVLNLRGLVCRPGPPLSVFAERFHRGRIGSMNQYFWLDHYAADDDRLKPLSKCELKQELQWARQRSTSHASVNNILSDASLAPDECGEPQRKRRRHDEPAFELALNGMERKFLNGYRRKSGGSAKYCCLQSNPDKVCVQVTNDMSSCLLPCLVKSMHLSWTDAIERDGVAISRWLSASEALVAQGFRLHPAVARDYCQSSFDVHISGRNYYHLRETADNCMALCCIGLAWTHTAVNYTTVESVESSVDASGPSEPQESPKNTGAADALSGLKQLLSRRVNP